jgi:hypothetical protein
VKKKETEILKGKDMKSGNPYSEIGDRGCFLFTSCKMKNRDGEEI